MKVTVGAKTDPGRRPNNEDQLLVVDVRRHGLRADSVLVIADGMGGRNFGERASQAAVETVGDTLAELLHSDRDPAVDIADALDSALRKANSRVYELGGQDEESRGMGTTCVAAVIENDHVYVAHAGDSRAYLLRHGELQRLTDDHSYVAEQVRAGNLSEENARKSRFRNVITRAVGIEPTITPDVSHCEVQGGDTLLLCTDGLSNMVPEEEIAQIMVQASSAQQAADRLVNLANRNGGRDNITAIVARLELGNRTQRMRAGDLAQIVGSAAPALTTEAAPEAERHRNGAEAGVEDDETPTVQPRRTTPTPRMPGPALPVEPDSTQGEAPEKRQTPRHRRGGGLALAVLSVLCLLFLGAAVYLGNVLSQAGYKFQAEPPFAVKPVPPRPPKPPDLMHVDYEAPAVLSPAPVEGGLLTYNPRKGTVIVLTLSGRVLHLSADGSTIYNYTLPKQYGPLPAAKPTGLPSGDSHVPPVAALPTPVQRLHWATDSQGNIYVADAVKKTLEKYEPNADFLRYIAKGQLHRPESLAVAADGSVFVVDAQRLTLIRAKTAPPAKP